MKRLPRGILLFLLVFGAASILELPRQDPGAKLRANASDEDGSAIPYSLLEGYAMQSGMSSLTQTSSDECEPPEDVPSDQVARYRDACAKIVQAMKDWQPPARANVTIGTAVGALKFAQQVDATIRKEIQVLLDQAKMDFLTFSFPYSSVVNDWQANRVLYQEYVNLTRQKGAEVWIYSNDEMDLEVTWSQFKTVQDKYIDSVMSLRPDFVAVSDPWLPWYPGSRITDKASVKVDQVVELVRDTASRCKGIDPNVRVYIGVAATPSGLYPQSLQLLNALLGAPEVDGWCMYMFSVDELKEASPLADQWVAQGKQICLGNLQYATQNRKDYVDNPWVDHLAAKYIDACVVYCRYKDIPRFGWAFSTFLFNMKQTFDEGIFGYRTLMGLSLEKWARQNKGLGMPEYPYPVPETGIRLRKWHLGIILFAAVVVLIAAFGRRARK